MTTSPLKVEDGRAQFEAWAEEVGALPWGYLKKQRTPGGGYSVQIYNYMWSAWQASRAAIVVELPEPHAHLIWIQAGHAPDDYWDDVEVSRSEKDKCCDGSDRYAVYAEHEVAEMLAAAGITVKGDS